MSDTPPLAPGPQASPPSPPSSLPSGGGDTLSTIIPYRNVPALIGYYVAVFALIPCVGIPLGIIAIVLGIVGLVLAKRNPAARGRVHAWFAVLFGAFCVLASIAEIVLAMYYMTNTH